MKFDICEDCMLKDSDALTCAVYELRMNAQALLQELTNGRLPKEFDDTCYSYFKKAN